MKELQSLGLDVKVMDDKTTKLKWRTLMMKMQQNAK